MISRVVLSGGTVLFAVVVYALMLKGWRSRQDRQSDLPEPALAAGGARALAAPVPGLFVGTTSAIDWLDRIAVHRLSDRATADLIVAEDGVHLVREGLPELFIPLSSLDAVSIEQSLAGKIVSGGMLVLTWRLGARTLATAFRATEHAAHVRLRDTLTALLPPSTMEAS